MFIFRNTKAQKEEIADNAAVNTNMQEAIIAKKHCNTITEYYNNNEKSMDGFHTHNLIALRWYRRNQNKKIINELLPNDVIKALGNIRRKKPAKPKVAEEIANITIEYYTANQTLRGFSTYNPTVYYRLYKLIANTETKQWLIEKGLPKKELDKIGQYIDFDEPTRKNHIVSIAEHFNDNKTLKGLDSALYGWLWRLQSNPPKRNKDIPEIREQLFALGVSENELDKIGTRKQKKPEKPRLSEEIILSIAGYNKTNGSLTDLYKNNPNDDRWLRKNIDNPKIIKKLIDADILAEELDKIGARELWSNKLLIEVIYPQYATQYSNKPRGQVVNDEKNFFWYDDKGERHIDKVSRLGQSVSNCRHKIKKDKKRPEDQKKIPAELVIEFEKIENSLKGNKSNPVSRNLSTIKYTGEKIRPISQKPQRIINYKSLLVVGTAILDGRFEKDPTNISNPRGLDNDTTPKHGQIFVPLSAEFKQKAVETTLYKNIRDLLRCVESTTNFDQQNRERRQPEDPEIHNAEEEAYKISEAEDFVLRLAEKLDSQDSALLLSAYDISAADPEDIDKAKVLNDILKDLKIKYNRDLEIAYCLVFSAKYDDIIAELKNILNKDNLSLITETIHGLTKIKAEVPNDKNYYQEVSELYYKNSNYRLSFLPVSIRTLRLNLKKLLPKIHEEITLEAEKLAANVI